MSVTDFKKQIQDCCSVRLGGGTSGRIVKALTRLGVVNEVKSTSASGGKFMKYTLSRPKRVSKRTRLDKSASSEDRNSSRRRTAILAHPVASYRWPEKFRDDLTGVILTGLRNVLSKTDRLGDGAIDAVVDSIRKGASMGELHGLSVDTKISIHSFLFHSEMVLSKG